MRIKKIHIQNFKSLVDFQLEDLKPFCAFVGPNASGKSNIFEALEFTNYVSRFSFEAPAFFGGRDYVLSYNPQNLDNYDGANLQFFTFDFFDGIKIEFLLTYSFTNPNFQNIAIIGYKDIHRKNQDIDITEIRDIEQREVFLQEFKKTKKYESDYEQFIDNFSRIFIGKAELVRTNQILPRLLPDASNLSQIIGQIFQDENKREDFIEWIRILIPEFENIEVKQSNIDGSFEFFIYEKSSNKPFPKYLISDGTYNILALMAAVYQNSQPQFLCIEEPENGLHPEAIELLVDFFREKCETEGHHIWLNTHSATLVRCLEIDEIILVNKINGETKAKQLNKIENIDIKTDEAWLSNALGGGVLWSQ